MICVYDGHETGTVQGRGLCHRHYRQVTRDGTLDNYPLLTGRPLWDRQPPLVCLCTPPLAHPDINFGECYICRRKPIALIEASVIG